MYILPTLTYLEVGGPADASKIIRYGHFKWEPIRSLSHSESAEEGWGGAQGGR